MDQRMLQGMLMMKTEQDQLAVMGIQETLVLREIVEVQDLTATPEAQTVHQEVMEAALPDPAVLQTVIPVVTQEIVVGHQAAIQVEDQEVIVVLQTVILVAVQVKKALNQEKEEEAELEASEAVGLSEEDNLFKQNLIVHPIWVDFFCARNIVYMHINACKNR